jgi:hypothetical protein
VKEIPTKCGRTALIDDEDYGLVSQYRWYARKVGARGENAYALGYRRLFRRRYERTQMHRLVMKVTDPKIQIDHINGNALDNRKQNLRLCTQGQNSRNKPSIAGYKGVRYVHAKKTGNPWRATISANRKSYYIGRFKTCEEAGVAYDILAHELHGEFAHLNFPGLKKNLPHPAKVGWLNGESSDPAVRRLRRWCLARQARQLINLINARTDAGVGVD